MALPYLKAVIWIAKLPKDVRAALKNIAASQGFTAVQWVTEGMPNNAAGGGFTWDSAVAAALALGGTGANGGDVLNYGIITQQEYDSIASTLQYIWNTQGGQAAVAQGFTNFYPNNAVASPMFASTAPASSSGGSSGSSVNWGTIGTDAASIASSIAACC